MQFGKIAIIGAGNVAYILCKILKDKELNPFCIYVRNSEKAKEVHQDLQVEVVSDYKKVLESELLMIAVNDDSISEVASHLVDYKGLAVHLSGTKSSELLNGVERHGVFYPLQTMSKNREISFEDTPILIYANSKEDLERLRDFAEIFSKKVFVCDDEQRKAIHLSAVFVSNFTDLMLGIGDKLLKDKGLSISIMKSLVKETVEKCFSDSPEKALTGPARRGDFATIGAHEEMLSEHPREKEIYELLTNYIIEKYH